MKCIQEFELEKKIAVFYYTDDRQVFVTRPPLGGLWDLPTSDVFGVRDDTIHVATSQASRVGLTCSVDRIKEIGEFKEGRTSYVLISAGVCCARFWNRDGAKMVSFEELSSNRNMGPMALAAFKVHEAAAPLLAKEEKTVLA